MRKEKRTGKSCVNIEFPTNATRALMDSGGRKKLDGRTTKGRILKCSLLKGIYSMLYTLVTTSKITPSLQALSITTCGWLKHNISHDNIFISFNNSRINKQIKSTTKPVTMQLHISRALLGTPLAIPLRTLLSYVENWRKQNKWLLTVLITSIAPYETKSTHFVLFELSGTITLLGIQYPVHNCT